MASCLGLGGDFGQPAAGVAVLFSRLDAAMLGTGWVLDVVRAAFGGASIAVGGGREGLAFGEATPAFGGATPAVGDGALDVSCNQRGGGKLLMQLPSQRKSGPRCSRSRPRCST